MDLFLRSLLWFLYSQRKEEEEEEEVVGDVDEAATFNPSSDVEVEMV